MGRGEKRAGARGDEREEKRGRDERGIVGIGTVRRVRRTGEDYTPRVVPCCSSKS